MKNFDLKQAVRWIGGFKAYVFLLFGAEVTLYTFVRQVFFGDTALPYSWVWQFLAIAVFTVLLQAACFSDWFFKRLRTSLRMVLFTLKMFCMLSVFAWVFRWFPMDDLMAWLVFGGIFLLFELAIALSFEVYNRLAGEKYTAQLELYKTATQKKR